MLFFVAVLFSFYLFVVKQNGVKASYVNSKKKYNQFSPTIKFLLWTAIFLIIIGFWMPFLLTRDAFIKELDFTNTGAIGDTFGGILNPFVGLSAVIVTGLAFYMQYQANQQIQDQFKIQRIESQFYEMLKLHKDNVNEIEITNEDNSKIIFKGRNAFTLFKMEFEMFLEMLDKSGDQFNDKNFDLLFRLFFVGNYEGLIIMIEEKMPNFHKRFKNSQPRCILEDDDELYFNIDEEYARFYKTYNIWPNLGYTGYLGHYYRHLYQMVSFIVKKYSEEVLDYDGAMNYLKILRAQLSNDEQVLLFYNWIAGFDGNGFGKNWENDKNKFFTEFLMLHNLPYGELFDNDYIKGKIQLLRDVKVMKREGNLFEWD